MTIYTGKELNDYLSSTDNHYENRDIKAVLDKYISSSSDKVMCLYGLRRTGKTVMMEQEMRDISDFSHTLYITCENDKQDSDSMYDIKQVLKENSDCKYIFIDEVTKLEDFINTASVLADQHAKCGQKVVLAGTDSLGFVFARSSELLDRCIMLHTTFVPYKEYSRLLDKDFDEYIMYGGTLTDGKTLYNTRDSLDEYTNSAITDNILHALERYGRGNDYDMLADMVDKGDVGSAINKVLEAHSGSFVAKVINKDFHSHDMGFLRELLTKHTDINVTVLKQIKDSYIAPYLHVKPLSDFMSDKAISMIERYLEELDLVYYDRSADRYIFTQPGMRYAQAQELVTALKENDVFSSYKSFEQGIIIETLLSDVQGQIFEDEIFLHLVDAFRDIESVDVRKIRLDDKHEADMVIVDKKAGASLPCEIKHSDQTSEYQWSHLNDESFISYIEDDTNTKVLNRAVIYRGDSIDSPYNSGIYINAGDFLCNINSVVTKLLYSPDVRIAEIKKLLSFDKKSVELPDIHKRRCR